MVCTARRRRACVAFSRSEKGLRKVGIEYRHIQNKEEKEWIRARIREHLSTLFRLRRNPERSFAKLIEAEQFEHSCTKYSDRNRFSLEGCEVIPMLDQLVEGASDRGTDEIYMGMAHRGRLNVLSNIVGDPDSGDMAERIFTVFEGTSHPDFPADEGDVKYHQGALGNKETKNGRKLKIRLSCNPSHLEFVNPVVEGMARARQDDIRNGEQKTREEVYEKILPVLLHGDAAFAGQGIGWKLSSLASLPAIAPRNDHIVINTRSALRGCRECSQLEYSTARADHTTPIFHINGDSPEAALRVMQISLDYRRQFKKTSC